MLKTVRMPISRRAGPTYFIAGWYDRANKKQKLLASSTPGTRSGITSSFAPSASRISAAPLFDEAARLPCLTTLAPAPAAMMPAAVEMLKVSCPSPPVPTISTTKPGSRESSTVKASDLITSARAWMMPGPHLSSVSNAKKAPIWACVAPPDMISFIASLASCGEISFPACRVLTAALTAPVLVMVLARLESGSTAIHRGF
mmetsp:Transcript_45474/g.97436  ORF Transcript_45474/g.97436 Transcript_45474/m.97436 type:complete len:201 (+) Transcript_45474:646-1248(+)